jgi:hypothetical protein
MKKIIVCIALCLFVGCTTTPVQSLVKGQAFGAGEKNLLHQLEQIAYYSAKVRDPDMSDKEFYNVLRGKTEGEFLEWVGRKDYEIRRFVNVVKLYSAISNSEGRPIPELRALSDMIQKHYDDLKYAQYLYYTEDLRLKD